MIRVFEILLKNSLEKLENIDSDIIKEDFFQAGVDYFEK